MDEAAKKLCFLRQEDPSETGNEEYTNLEMAKMELIDFNNKMSCLYAPDALFACEQLVFQAVT